MLRINQLKLPVGHSKSDLKQAVLHLLHISEEELLGFQIFRRSVDARKKPQIFYVYKKVAKRTAVQEQIILPLRAQNYATLVPGKKSERTVFTMAKFTIPDDKCLVVELNEKNGGRHQSFVIENEDLVRANTINELQVR